MNVVLEGMFMNSYSPEWFKIFELVDKKTYEKYKNRPDYLLRFFDPRILWTMDSIRNHFKRSVTVNDWYWGGNYQYRGLRPFNCKIGAILSMHKYGRAIDSKMEDMSAEEIRQDIFNNQDADRYKYITRVEMKVSWLHLDTSNVDISKGIIKIFP